MKRNLILTLLAVVQLAVYSSAEAGKIRAFHNTNQFVFKQIFGLPSLDNSPITKAGKWRINVSTNISNTFESSGRGAEEINVDGETLRSAVIVSYGFRKGWQMSLEVPFISHSKGFLDNFIYNWHDFFSLPQNGRNKDNSDQFHIAYLAESGSSFEMHESEEGFGDIRLNCTYMRPWKNKSLIFSWDLKVPTGNYEKLTGSGGYDLAAGLTINDPESLSSYQITLYGGFAGIFLGNIDGELASLQKNFAMTGRAGIGWQATEKLQLKLQFDALSPLYASNLKEMGDPSLQIIFGGAFFFNEGVYFDMSIAEDINTATAADVAFQLALTMTF